MNKINCAVYVRKSTEKGLEQEFNSLHNQEESCKSYILSQAFNGWEYQKTYEDGGVSGGTMKRPGLEEMIVDIKKGLIRTVVVYKVDRLSRSIIDFHNMMKEFEKYDCNFVSITQAFDTSNSMGKLTLNMLLSFAQFERELASERVKHKIAATKAKGLWVGGIHPLGYDVVDKKLVINNEEAERVNYIFRQYVGCGALSKLREHLKLNKVYTKCWVSKSGIKKGGKLMSVSMLARMLRDKVYIGKVENKKTGEVYKGVHKSIVSKELYDNVQTLLGSVKEKTSKEVNKETFMLSGKIINTNGDILKNHKSSKYKEKKYRYYTLKGLYLPSGDVEAIVVDTFKSLLNCDLSTLLAQSKVAELKSIDFENMASGMQYKLIKKMVNKVIYSNDKLICYFNVEDLSYVKDFKTDKYLNNRKGSDCENMYISEDDRFLIVETDIFINDRVSTNKYEANGRSIITTGENSQGLIRALSYGWKYKKFYEQGLSIAKIGKQEQKTERTIYKYLNLMYLSPHIINDVMESKVPEHIGLQELFAISSKNIDFQRQETSFYK